MPEPSAQSEAPLIIPYRELEETTLRAVIESFVLREGTDYGHRETSLDAKVAQVLAQLQSGEARIVFDRQSETVSIELSRAA